MEAEMPRTDKGEKTRRAGGAGHLKSYRAFPELKGKNKIKAVGSRFPLVWNRDKQRTRGRR
jgi:hypothetical protein